MTNSDLPQQSVNKRQRQKGKGSDARPLPSALWSADSKPDHVALVSEGNVEANNEQVNYRRYYDPQWLAQEFKHLFAKTWLFVCREEDIPNVGDRLPFDIGPQSIFIIRSGDNDFKAFYNACVHRATTLCTEAETDDIIRCPYHGWEWHVDGKLKRIPSHWDFTRIDRQNGSLREVKLARWGGFIFVNLDADNGSLEEALQVLPEHFKEWNPANRYTAAHFRKNVKANWKIAQEAFMESYHVYATHPEAMSFSGDTQTQYDIWQGEQGCVGRNGSPGAIPSMNADAEFTMATAAQMFAQALRDWHYPNTELPAIDESTEDPRKQLADWHRDAIEAKYAYRSELPDAMMMDSLLYFMFPHFGLWLCESLPFSYQFMPHPTDPAQCFFEVRLLLPCIKGEARPPAAKRIDIAADESIMDKSEGFSFLAYVFDQDMSNMPLIQKGVSSADPAQHHSELGSYQEMLIQHWNQRIDQYLGQGQ